jgi:hypothetical protein
MSKLSSVDEDINLQDRLKLAQPNGNRSLGSSNLIFPLILKYIYLASTNKNSNYTLTDIRLPYLVDIVKGVTGIS